MTRDKLITILTTLLIAVSCLVNGPFEAALYVVLLLGVLYLQNDSRKSKYLIFLACLVAAACIDALINNVWLSGLLMIGRHIGTAVLFILILVSMLKKRETEKLQLPQKRPRLIVTAGILSFGAVLVVARLATSRPYQSPSALIPPLLMLTLAILVYLIVKRLSNRWGSSALLYIPVLLIVGCLLIQLIWDSIYLAAVHDIHTAAASRNKIPAGFSYKIRQFPSTFQTPAMIALLDESTNSDGAIRASAVRGLGHKLWQETYFSMPDDLNYRDWPTDPFWQHPYWQGEHSNQVVHTLLPQIIEFLSDDDPRVRIAAFISLREVGPWGTPAVPALRNILQVHGETSRNQRTGQESVAEAFETMQRVQENPGSRLKDLEPGIIRIEVPEAFGSIGPGARDAVPDLIPLLKDVLWPAQQNAAMALGRIGPDAKDAIPALEAAASLKSNDDRVRTSSALALWSIEHNPPLVPQVLREILSDGTPEGKSSAADAVYRIGLPAADWAIPVLIPLTTHEDENVKNSAFSALCEIGIDSVESVEAVLKAFQSDLQTNGKPNQDFEDDLERLKANVRGPAADALKQGMEKINSSSNMETE